MRSPGLIHLCMTAVVEATNADHPNREFYVQRYEGLTPKIVQEIRDQQASGNVDLAEDPERIARILLATIEGLQVRWLYRPDFDLVAEFLFTLE